MLRPQSINCLVCVSFAIQNGASRQAEPKKFRFFEKNICILPVGYLTSSALNRCSFNHQRISKIKVKEFVFILLFLWIFICIHYLCSYFIDLYLFTNTWPILDSESIGALFGAYCLEKRKFCLLTHSWSRCHF